MLSLLTAMVLDIPAGHAGDPGESAAAARVNEIPITREAVKRAAALIQVTKTGETDQAREASRQLREKIALENLIIEELMFQEARNRGIQIEEEKVYEVIRKMKETMPGREFTKLAFAHWAVKDEILKTIERDLMIKKLYQEMVLDQAKVTEEDLTEFYNANQPLFRTGPEVRLQQILLYKSPAWQAELLESKAEELAALARSGEDFLVIAREYSQGPASEHGGDLGWRSVAHLPPALMETVSGAEIGTVIGPLQIKDGYLIVKVMEKRPSRPINLEEAREHLTRTLHEKKLLESHTSFLQSLYAKATIEILAD